VLDDPVCEHWHCAAQCSRGRASGQSPPHRFGLTQPSWPHHTLIGAGYPLKTPVMWHRSFKKCRRGVTARSSLSPVLPAATLLENSSVHSKAGMLTSPSKISGQ
jgi:hypothetical protein